MKRTALILASCVACWCTAPSAGATTPDRAFAAYGVMDGYGEALWALTLAFRDQLSLETIIRNHPPASVGRIDGALLFGVQMKDSEGVWIRDPDGAWAVPETINALVGAAAEVRRLHPGGMELSVGDISRRTGGRFAPHRTHQCGRDADMRYFLKDVLPGDREHHFVGPDNIDLERQWTFIKTLIERGQAEVIYMDYRHQKTMYDFLIKQKGYTAKALEPIFSYPRGQRVMTSVIQHMKNHYHHLHVRVFAPKAQLFGLLWTPKEALALQRKVDVATRGHLEYVIKDGDTLGRIAKQYNVPLEDLMTWNSIGPKTRLKLGDTLKVFLQQPLQQ